MNRKVKFRGQEVLVDLEDDSYGSNYWDRIENRLYEPDTLSFIEDNCHDSTDFMDIGAANGAMTLFAAINGARVFSYEPDPRIYEVVKRNINLNKKFEISLQNKAISNQSGTITFGSHDHQEVISEIVLTGLHKHTQQKIEVLALVEEVSRIHTDFKRKLVVKMDIEGAEWKILGDVDTLSELKRHSAVLLLAVHPGFYRPYKPFFKGIDKFRVALWHRQNQRDSRDLFRKLIKVSSVYRTNLNPIISSKQFALLVFAGYHEFVIDFNKK